MLKVIQFRTKTLHTPWFLNKWFSTEFESKDTLLQKSLNFWRIAAWFLVVAAGGNTCTCVCISFMIAQPHCIMEPCQMPGLAGSFLLCSVAMSIAHCSHLHSGEGSQETGGKNVLGSSCSFSTYIQSITRGPSLTLLWMARLHSYEIGSSHFPSPASMPTQFLLPLCGISETTSNGILDSVSFIL